MAEPVAITSSPTAVQPASARVAVVAGVWAFCVYFCMYAFRKPFAAASYEGAPAWGVEAKTVLVVSQLIGYTLSKYLGARFSSEVQRKSRLKWLLLLILAAELSLIGFWLLPWPGKVACLFLNGLPLGMVWGLVVMYLEGRRTSELSLAALSCSFIVASGAVKDVGRWLLKSSVDPFAMPAAVGALFLVPLILCGRLLDSTPEPTRGDEEMRHQRTPMNKAKRRHFLAHHGLGLVLLFAVYIGLTALRDFRDNYGVELFAELGYDRQPALFTLTELPVAALVLVICAGLVRFQDRVRGFIAVCTQSALGLLLLPVATVLLQAEWLNGQGFMILVGLGAYMAYVPFSSFLFDRLMALTQAAGTAVFAVNLADGLGYTGSVLTLLGRDVWLGEATRLEFFLSACRSVGLGGALAMVVAGGYFLRRERTSTHGL